LCILSEQLWDMGIGIWARENEVYALGSMCVPILGANNFSHSEPVEERLVKKS